MRRWIRRFWPILAMAVVLGAAVGIAGFTFVYAKGSAYLTNDPAACANCHVMREHFTAWQKSSHHAVAVCNDCHAPSSFVAKYWVKARNGFAHSLAFTTGNYPEALRIKPHNRRVTEGACRRCHGALAAMMDVNHRGDDVSCTRCHRSVGHLTLD